MSSLLLLLTVFFLAAPSYADEISVTVQPLSALWQDYVYDAPADVVAVNRTAISAEIISTVKAINVRLGDSVKKGDTLLELDCERYDIQQEIRQATLAKAKAQLPLAKDQLQRALELRKNKSVSSEVVDQRRTELDVASAELTLSQQQLKLAQRDVDHCQVRAPFDGLVIDRHISLGSYVTAGQALIDLLEDRNLEVKARLRKTQLDDLIDADRQWFEVDKREYDVQLGSVVKVLDRQSLTMEVRMFFEDQHTALPGETGRLRWRNRQKYLPADYLLRRSQGLGVFILDDNQAKFVIIKDAIEGLPFKVSLSAETLLIVEGRQRLKDGDSVQISAID